MTEQSRQTRGTILVVEDDRQYLEYFKRVLEPAGFCMEWVHDPAEGLAAYERLRPDVVLLDLYFEGSSPKASFSLLSSLRERDELAKVIVVTGSMDQTDALEAIDRGAADFIRKGSGMKPDLLFRVQAVLERRILEGQIRDRRKSDIEGLGGFPYGGGRIIVGTSPGMMDLYRRIERSARCDETVLISGESGTGKELVAHAVHHHSARSKGPMITLNCAALPDSLIEDELFGHCSGAFSGAKNARKGAFEAAQGGSIFLDEIGDMPLGVQASLLRVAQEKKIRRVGENDEHAVDIRIIAATNRDLEARVAEGTFRQDLFFRLRALHLTVPPLRQRGADIRLLAAYFTDSLCLQYNLSCQFTDEALATLERYPWPGNIRELRDVINSTLIFADTERIPPERIHFQSEKPAPTESGNRSTPTTAGASVPVRVVSYKDACMAFENWYVEKVCGMADGNQTQASRMLDVDRNTIRRILNRKPAIDLIKDIIR